MQCFEMKGMYGMAWHGNGYGNGNGHGNGNSNGMVIVWYSYCHGTVLAWHGMAWLGLVKYGM